jgi:type IV pilus assembly protein PilV
MLPIIRSHGQRGSSLIEGLLALVVFSIGLMGLLMLLSATLIDSGQARYRSEASFLASDLVARLWSGDRSLASLQSRFGNTESDDYQTWLQRVQASLPGTSAAANQPVIEIDNERNVIITIGWQTPGETRSHRVVVSTRVTD